MQTIYMKLFQDLKWRFCPYTALSWWKHVSNVRKPRPRIIDHGCISVVKQRCIVCCSYSQRWANLSHDHSCIFWVYINIWTILERPVPQLATRPYRPPFSLYFQLVPASLRYEHTVLLGSSGKEVFEADDWKGYNRWCLKQSFSCLPHILWKHDPIWPICSSGLEA